MTRVFDRLDSPPRQPLRLAKPQGCGIHRITVAIRVVGDTLSEEVDRDSA